MKVLIFAHTPPPHHGQSQMVQYLVDGLATARQHTTPDSSHPLQLFHVDARLSDDLEDVGRPRFGKLWSLIRYCAQTLSLRFRHGIDAFYYVPSPPKRASLYRDWIVLLLCRPFFKRTVFHWHAVGLGAWLESHARPWERALSRLLLGRVHLSIVLSELNRADAQKLFPRHIAVVPNGIPDPCPQFETTLAPHREARARQFQIAKKSPAPSSGETVVHVLFLALCTRDKGVHDAARAIIAANQSNIAAGCPLRFFLTVAGSFVTHDEKREFDQLTQSPETRPWFEHRGFLGPAEKRDAYSQADLFLFPTYFANEGQPLNVIEAMAYGLPIVSTRWRAIPEYFPRDYKGLTEPRDVPAIAHALHELTGAADHQTLRETFLARFTVQRHLASLTNSFSILENNL